MSFSFQDRKSNIDKLKSKHFDVVIVGGGITGAGVARDAASRGMSVALVEAKDFAHGTSSRSSKLIHGGVRYLENFEFSLVFEALAERALLFKMAPHLVHPLRFMIPIYKSSRVGYWKMLAGMWLYDLLALFETPQVHESLDANETLERVPSLEGRELVGAMEYSDAYTDDDRLVLETLRDANRKGAVITSYTEVSGVDKEGDEILGLRVRDMKSGEEFKITGDQFVSGVGPWTDIFGKGIDSNWKNRMRPTKGVHLTFSRKKIPIQKAVVMAVEKRIIFVIPRHEMVIVGTTDTDFNKDPIEVTTEVEDVQYILAALNRYFPSLNIDERDITSSYCGVRPLVDDGSSSEGKTSREHSIFDHGPNMTFVAGGKYTTYRKISEEVVDHVLKKMPFDIGMSFGKAQTSEPLNPRINEDLYFRAIRQIGNWSKEFSVDRKMVAQLVNRHGEEAKEILKVISEKYQTYSANEAMWMGEADFAIDETMCMNLCDFYWRRSPLFLASKSHGMKYLNAILHVFKSKLGWDEEEALLQQQKLMEQMHNELHWRSELDLGSF